MVVNAYLVVNIVVDGLLLLESTGIYALGVVTICLLMHAVQNSCSKYVVILS